jgi:glycerate 2-kinase
MIGRPMKVVIAPDKFKGSLTAPQAADAIAAGVRRAVAGVEVDLCPIADGGDGFVDTMIRATGGKIMTHRVTGPLPEMKIDAAFGILPDGQTAVIEMAAAAGLALLSPEQRNPMATTTFGVGELMRRAVEQGCKHILLGIGGSATTDAGIGCAQATGHTIILDDGEPVSMSEPLCGRDLARVVMVKRHRGEVTDGVNITVACDVTSPLYGPTGAAYVFGPQKGATPEMVRELDDALRSLVAKSGMATEAAIPGAGAAGGLGFGLLAYYGAKLVSGIDLVLDATKLRERLRGADLCITAEGCFDGQSLQGKCVAGVAQLCREAGVPCVVLAGSIGDGADCSTAAGITGYFSIVNRPLTLEQAIHEAPALLSESAENVARIFRARGA